MPELEQHLSLSLSWPYYAEPGKFSLMNPSLEFALERKMRSSDQPKTLWRWSPRRKTSKSAPWNRYQSRFVLKCCSSIRAIHIGLRLLSTPWNHFVYLLVPGTKILTIWREIQDCLTFCQISRAVPLACFCSFSVECWRVNKSYLPSDAWFLWPNSSLKQRVNVLMSSWTKLMKTFDWSPIAFLTWDRNFVSAWKDER